MPFLASWTYRKAVNINAGSGAGTNYQMKLYVGESAGSSGANFHVSGNANSFPSAKDTSGDIRFTASDGTTLLNFWVESVTGTTPNRTAIIWVKVTATLDSNQTIYCYYKGTTTNVSSGDNTFEFHDDFPGTSLDTTNKWVIDWSSTVSVSGSVLSLAQTANQFARIHTKNWTGLNYRYRALMQLSGFERGRISIGPGGAGETDIICQAFDVTSSDSWVCGSTACGWTLSGPNYFNPGTTTFHVWEFRIKGTTGYCYSDDSESVRVQRTCPSIVASAFNIAKWEGGVNLPQYTDWAFVAKLASVSEPAFGSAGNQETGNTRFPMPPMNRGATGI